MSSECRTLERNKEKISAEGENRRWLLFFPKKISWCKSGTPLLQLQLFSLVPQLTFPVKCTAYVAQVRIRQRDDALFLTIHSMFYENSTYSSTRPFSQ